MQLFHSEHYGAFEPPKPELNDKKTIRERQNVRDKLLELDKVLWPFIETQGWDLHRHRQASHYVSSDQFIYLDDGTPIVKNIDGIWLHYGKSPEQLDFMKKIGGNYTKRDLNEYYNAFYLHTRIQFYLNNRIFKCWLLLATDKNYYDRSEFLRKIAIDIAAKDKLFKLIIPLFDKGFFYEIDAEKLPLNSEVTQNQLISFIKKDKDGKYSGIVKEYQPEDELLSIDKIGEEMIENLKLLYPLYNFMAFRPNTFGKKI
jgi:hypothetical protein